MHVQAKKKRPPKRTSLPSTPDFLEFSLSPLGAFRNRFSVMLPRFIEVAAITGIIAEALFHDEEERIVLIDISIEAEDLLLARAPKMEL